MERAICLLFCSMLILISTAGSASAQEAPEEERSGKYATVTISMLNFAKPVLSDETIEYDPEFEMMAEGNIVDMFGVAGVFAYNHATGKNLGEPYGMNLYRFGLQGVWYAVGHFGEGLQLGVQGLYKYASVDDEVESVELRAAGDSVSGAGLVGYKTTIGPGFTLLAQLGGGVEYIRAEASAEASGVEASDERSGFSPQIVFNVNLGWTL